MPAFALDFGTSSTCIAVWDSSRGEAVPYPIEGWSRTVCSGDGNGVPVVPSLIHYSPGGERWIGRQVTEQGVLMQAGTFRWMKHYVGNRNPVLLPVNGRKISYLQAGEDFLSAIIRSVAAELGGVSADVALTVPVEAFEHYETWLGDIARRAGLPNYRIIDEASAAALGYGISIQPGHTYLVFDFGGGTLDIAMVRMEEGSEGGFPRCRVLGKAGEDFGGFMLDQWLYREVLRRCSLRDDDPGVAAISSRILQACEQAKEVLSYADRATLQIPTNSSAHPAEVLVTLQEFEELLEAHGLYTKLHAAIQRAISNAIVRGYPEEEIRGVLMVGGSSAIPSVQKLLRQRFGQERVYFNRPFDAVARGAAQFAAGTEVFDHIQHDYAVRHWNTRNHRYDYRVIVRKGTNYPEPEVARITIRATHEGQRRMGIPIYEVGGSRSSYDGTIELVTDGNGGVRFVEIGLEDEERRSRFWMNEESPTFLTADPPATPGEPRFELIFGIDGNKRLLLTSKDLQTGRLIHRLHPVIGLR